MLVGTILHVNNAAVGLIGCLYFWLVSKNWLWLEIFAGGIGLLALAGTGTLMPESPKFLVAKKRYEEARESINYMSRFMSKKKNVNYFYGMFDTEVQDRKSQIGINYLNTNENTGNNNNRSSGELIRQSIPIS